MRENIVWTAILAILFGIGGVLFGLIGLIQSESASMSFGVILSIVSVSLSVLSSREN